MAEESNWVTLVQQRHTNTSTLTHQRCGSRNRAYQNASYTHTTHTHTPTHARTHVHASTHARTHAGRQAGRQAGRHPRTHARTPTHTLSLSSSSAKVMLSTPPSHRFHPEPQPITARIVPQCRCRQVRVTHHNTYSQSRA